MFSLQKKNMTPIREIILEHGQPSLVLRTGDVATSFVSISDLHDGTSETIATALLDVIILLYYL